MSLDAYARTAAQGELDSEKEYRLFGRVTGALIDARDQGLKGAPLMKALDWNRRMWSTLAIDCADANNRLPDELRAGIISLSIFVRKQTRKVFHQQASIDDLIEINRRVMTGLEEQIKKRKAAQAAEAEPFEGLSGRGAVV